MGGFLRSWRRAPARPWSLLILVGLALLISGCGAGGTATAPSTPNQTAAASNPAPSLETNLLAPDPVGLGNRSYDSETVAMRGGDIDANTMERCAGDDGGVFHTALAKLPSDTNGTYDVYLVNTNPASYELVSVNAAGTGAGNNQSLYGVISADSRYVAFASRANDLVPGTTGTHMQIYLRDRVAGTTTLLSVAPDGVTPGNIDSSWPAMSSDGQFVAFTSTSTNLVPGDTNNRQDIFLRNVATGTTTVVAAGDEACFQPAISGDGRYVAFSSQATNLVPGDTNGWLDIFIYDTQTMTMERVNVSSSGVQTNAPSWSPSLSDDGSRIAFESTASNLVTGDTNGKRDVFIRDRSLGLTGRFSLSQNGDQADGDSFHCSLTRDGSKLAFATDATNLFPNDTNGVRDVVWREIVPGTRLVSQKSDGTLGDGPSTFSSTSEDGLFVVFQSTATNLVDNDTNGCSDIFLRDVANDTTTRISVGPGAVQANGASYAPSISADGSFVAYHSEANNLVAGDTNNLTDVFLYEVATGLTTRQDVSSTGVQSNYGPSTNPSLSEDGTYVAFCSRALNLVPGVSDYRYHIYVRNTQTGAIVCASADANGVPGNGSSYYPSLSATGSHVTFYSLATNLDLVTPDLNGRADIFIHDLSSNVTTLVSVSSAGVQGTNHSYYSSVSGDGRYVAFSSYAPNLVAGDTNACRDIFLRDTTTKTTTRISVSSAGNQAVGTSDNPVISKDGRWVAFWSVASNLVAGDTNGVWDVFTHDCTMASTARVSLDPYGNQVTGGNSLYPSMSPDGRYVAFYSAATDLVSGDTNGVDDVYLRDRAEVTLEQASTLPTNGGADQTSWTDDGANLVYRMLWTGLSRYIMLYDLATQTNVIVTP